MHQSLAKRRQPWEQQPGETAKAFGTFVCYLGLGDRRTLKLAAAECGLQVHSAEHFSRKHRWRERLEAFQAHLLSKQLATAEQLVARRPVEWDGRVKELRDAEWRVAEQGFRLCQEEIQRILRKKRRLVGLSDINRLLEVCSKLGRLATGLATERGELTGADGEPIRLEVAAAIAKVYGGGAVVDVTPSGSPEVLAVEPQIIPETIPAGASGGEGNL